MNLFYGHIIPWAEEKLDFLRSEIENNKNAPINFVDMMRRGNKFFTHHLLISLTFCDFEKKNLDDIIIKVKKLQNEACDNYLGHQNDANEAFGWVMMHVYKAIRVGLETLNAHVNK